MLSQPRRCACLLACLAAGALSAEPPADPAAWMRELVVRHGLEARESELAEWIDARLETHEVGRNARLFDAAMAEPLAFAAPLGAFAKRFVGAAPMPWQERLALALRQWAGQYDVEGDCDRGSLGPARDLDHAVAQVRALAEAAAQPYGRALGKRARQRLAADYAEAGNILRDRVVVALGWRERRRLRRFLGRLAAADAGAVLCSAMAWTRLTDANWLSRLRELIAAHPDADADIVLRAQTPFGDITVGGRADARMRSANVLFHADLAGDDFYGLEAPADFAGKPQFIVDFAGEDEYASALPGGYAGGVGRTALLVDFAGDDIYRAAAHAQGSAVLGVGALIDLGGNDRYAADSHAQGAATFGAGLLLDARGDDRYRVRAMGQGMGLTHGLGALLDLGGNDSYVATGTGQTNYGTPGLADTWSQGVGRGARGIAPGGIGVLADHAGDDRYDAGSFSQGGAYYQAVGLLLDRGAGNDVLNGSRYNAGWGAHGGVGLFANAAGDDRYSTRHVVAAGLAWDYSLAMFRDDAGDDHYRLGAFSLGAAAHGAVAWFLDLAGNDRYAGADRPAARYAEQPNFALFVDRGGDRDTWQGKEPARPSCEFGAEQGFALWLASGAETLPECAAGPEPIP